MGRAGREKVSDENCETKPILREGAAFSIAWAGEVDEAVGIWLEAEPRTMPHCVIR